MSLIIFHRAPPLPIQCFYSNCYAESVKVLNSLGKVTGLQFQLVGEGTCIVI